MEDTTVMSVEEENPGDRRLSVGVGGTRVRDVGFEGATPCTRKLSSFYGN